MLDETIDRMHEANMLSRQLERKRMEARNKKKMDRVQRITRADTTYVQMYRENLSKILMPSSIF